ncbi:MAG: alanine--glyoxylate aminotransferase family protein [Candidatus Aminicenantes bacterium]|nr:alanine--glyoxylate aminotransferase family protein [Candidatus Aminicenantes bacterium]
MIKKKYLLSPGPTPLPEEVLSIASEPIFHHRTPEFSQIYSDVTDGLKYVFQTENDVYILASSGSGAMEAAVVNTLNPRDKVICINCGKFGARWAHIARAYGADVKEIILEWGENFSKAQLNEVLGEIPETKAVFSTLFATSTGALYDIQGFGEVVSSTQAILIVDGISGLGATPCPMDGWNIDVLISGSQKAFMTPPGLAYISISKKAWDLVESSTLPKFYFNAKEYRKSLRSKTSPWSPAISLIVQQKKSLEIIKSLGLENLIHHHQILGTATRNGVQALGLDLLPTCPGNVLTAVKVPEEIDGIKLVKIMHEKYKVTIAGAQSPHTGDFFRIAHLGYMGGFDVITALSALEMTLMDLGYSFEPGVAIKAAEIIIKENWE